jgi:hypothetical protein
MNTDETPLCLLLVYIQTVNRSMLSQVSWWASCDSPGYVCDFQQKHVWMYTHRRDLAMGLLELFCDVDDAHAPL